MQTPLLCILFCAALVGGQVLKCPKYRLRLAKAECAPVRNAEPEDCIDPCRNKIITPENCDQARHCCMYNCRCIMRGAGTALGRNIKNYKQPRPKTAIQRKAKLLPGCTPTNPVRRPAGNKRPRTRPNGARPGRQQGGRPAVSGRPKGKRPKQQPNGGGRRPKSGGGKGQNGRTQPPKRKRPGGKPKPSVIPKRKTTTKEYVPTTRKTTTTRYVPTTRETTTTKYVPTTRKTTTTRYVPPTRKTTTTTRYVPTTRKTTTTRKPTTRKTTTTRKPRTRKATTTKKPRTRKTTTTRRYVPTTTKRTRKTTTPCKADPVTPNKIWGGLASLFGGLGFGFEVVKKDC